MSVQNKNPFKSKVEMTANPHEAEVLLDEAEPSEEKEVEAHVVHAAPAGLYQSDEARQAATKPEDAQQELKSARIETPTTPPRQVVVQQTALLNRMVRVRPRVTVSRFKIGKEWYQIRANVDVLVPKHVAVMLEQKGML